MRLLKTAVVLGTVLISACSTSSSMKPVEYMDDRTALTVGSLKEPIELVPRLGQASLPAAFGSLSKKVSFAYLGPVEWDRSGTIVYGLWVHLAPANSRPLADIRSPAALTLILDGATRVLKPMDAPQLGRGPYEAVASWGQTAYFELTVEMLKQMAATQKLELNARAADDSIVNFTATGDTRETLSAYIRARGITAD
jgi:capsular polysaccharide biosynthesis protein